jgi:predicted TIM-barrel fold metal-dependent hydrolase
LSSRSDGPLVDADVHPTMTLPALRERLSPLWREHFDTYGGRVAGAYAMFPRMRNGGFRVDARPQVGPPGSDIGLVQQQLLDEYGIDHAVLNPLQGQVWAAEAPDLAAALCRALNDWVAEEWLDRDPRFLGSICPPFEHPELAVAEIERVAGDDRFVQVLLPTTPELPLGDRRYWPVLQAAADAGLPVALHTGGQEQHRGAGWPSYYLEMHVWNGNTAAMQLLSVLTSGVLDAIPHLQIISVECGIAWAAALSWALDDAWSFLRDDAASALDRAPSELLRERFWFTTQPIEEPDDPGQLAFAFDALGMTDRIIFSTDYPHWDFDAPGQALPRALAPDVRAAILGENAVRLYGLRVGALR